MNENEGRKRREWVKNVAIIFLIIMLLLTFFSNTIMNYSLPEVATQYVQSGTITAKVRGTGNVEANDPYNVMVKESRVISSVAVKQGDQVEKDQVLYYLEDAESDELKKAEDELEELELAYMKGLFGGTVSSDIINKVASGNTDTFASYQAKVADMQNRLDAAQARVKECQTTLDNLTLQSTVNTNNASVSTIDEENEVTQATTDLSNAQTKEANEKEAFNNEIAARKMAIESEIKDIQYLIDSAENVTKENTVSSGDVNVNIGESGDVSVNVNGSNGSQNVSTSTLIQGYIKQRDEALNKCQTLLNDIYSAAVLGGYNGGQNIDELKKWIDESGNYENYKEWLQNYDTEDANYNYAVQKIEEAQKNLNGYEANLARKAELEQELINIMKITYQPGDTVKTAQEKLDQVKQNLADKTNANKQASVSYQNQIANAESALKNAQAVYDLLKTEQTELAADINAELDLSKTSKDITEKKEEIARLREKSEGAAITAPVTGMVTNLAYVAGETTKPEEAAAVIQPEGKGYTLTISVTNEQAKKVQVGDTAELQNAWYYDDVQAVLAKIKPDPDNPGQKKLLTFDVTGSSIQSGQALNISVGQRSSEYEFVVPNSAIREDNNGKFILIVESKSSPLGNRYIAARVDVEVLASDDNNTAISAGLYGYEYVITTSTKPVEAGKQVRLNE